MTLARIQQDIQAAILSGEIGDITRAKETLRFPDRLTAHLGAYPAFIGDYIANMYPGLQKILREDLGLISEEFCRKSQPSSYDSTHILISFNEFFCQHPRVRAFPFLVDLCHFEMAETSVYHAAPPENIDMADVGQQLQTQPERVFFRLQSHVRLLSFCYRLTDFFKKGGDIVSSLNETEAFLGDSSMLLYQKDWNPHYFDLSPDEKQFIGLLQEHSFSNACQLADRQDETQDYTNLLVRLLSQQILLMTVH